MENSSGGYIPGLPTVPSSQGAPTSYRSDSKIRGGRDLDIGRVEVTIGIDETSITEPKKRKIKSLVAEVIPQIKDCEDCIKIQAMPFQSNPKNAEIELLREEVEQLQTDIRDAQLKADAMHLEELEAQIQSNVEARRRATAVQEEQLVAMQEMTKRLQFARDAIGAFAQIETNLQSFDAALANSGQSIANAFGPAVMGQISSAFKDLTKIVDKNGR